MARKKKKIRCPKCRHSVMLRTDGKCPLCHKKSLQEAAKEAVKKREEAKKVAAK